MRAPAALLPLLAALFIFPAATASAQEVDLATSDVPGCITIVPGNDHVFDYVVTVNDGLGNPAVGATVTVTFTSGAEALIAWCDGQDHPGPLTPSRVDGAGNEYVFNISGAGCVNSQNQACGSPAARVDVSKGADSFSLDLFCINSPDVVSTSGEGAMCPDASICKPNVGNCPGNGTAVSLGDAVYHSNNISNALADLCTDFTTPYGDPMNLGDAVIITNPIKDGAFCCCP